jgi:esterase/lipase superfamily enzyme
MSKKLISAGLAALLLSGCVGDKAEYVHSVWRGPEPQDATREVYFVTDRAPDVSWGGFGKHWSGRLACGRTTVVIPPDNLPGEKIATGRIDPTSTRPVGCGAGAADFASAVAADAMARHCNEVLLYVHGFNTLFDGAVLRAGQVALDTHSGCVAAVFSWSSEGEIGRYVADIEHSAYAVPELETVLRALAKAGLRVDLLGHSIGARVALSALAALAKHDNPPPDGFVGELILAAADIGADPVNNDFIHLLNDARPFVHRTTVYASSGDAVLAVSAVAHGNVPRTGRRPKSDAKIHEIDAVDATDAPAELLGHSYFGMSVEAVGDIGLVLQGAAIDRRPTLTLEDGRHVLIVAPDRRPDFWVRLVRKLAPLLPRIELAPLTGSGE